MTQFQKEVYKYYLERYRATDDGSGNNEVMSKQWWLIMPDIVPQSSIVYEQLDNTVSNTNDDKCSEFMQRASKIYARYVAVGAELEVNISWNTREQLIDIFDNVCDMQQWLNNAGDNEKDKLEAIYALFVECMAELHYLLNSLFMRFKKSALFEKIMQRSR